MRDDLRPDYGMDAPAIVKRFAALGAASLAVTVALALSLQPGAVKSALLVVGISATLSAIFPALSIPFGSLVLKFKVRDWLLRQVAWNSAGSERVLDVGCGHGLLLIGVAKRLVTGRAVGLDLWAQDDQASNSREAALHNADLEGVRAKVEVLNGDMRKMPFADSQFDLIVSSWAIHNIYDRAQRQIALAEIVRVLKPDGQIAIVDIERTSEYLAFFSAAGLKDVRKLGPKFTFGNLSYLVLARKPKP